MIREKLSDEENNNFTFCNKTFEDIKELPQNDIIISNFAISFCNPLYFHDFWRAVCDSINKDGYFLGNFFGINDEWNGKKKLMSFFDINKVRELFLDFDIIELEEREYNKPTALGVEKHWDVIDVFARKK